MRTYHDLRYRDYVIYQWGWSDQWAWKHADYGGAGDTRKGRAGTIEACMQAIDNRYLDEAIEVLSRPYPSEVDR